MKRGALHEGSAAYNQQYDIKLTENLEVRKSHRICAEMALYGHSPMAICSTSLFRPEFFEAPDN